MKIKWNCIDKGKLCPGFKAYFLTGIGKCLIIRNPGEVKKPWFCQGVKQYANKQ